MASSQKVVYASRVRIERQRGPMRLAYLPAKKAPVVFGVHSEVAEHYKVPPKRLSTPRDDTRLCCGSRDRLIDGNLRGCAGSAPD